MIAGSLGGLIYRVNARDEIVHVSADWDAFADHNGGAAVRSERVLHRPLLRFVSDPTTRHLYGEVLSRARGGSSVVFPFRCDSPSERRLLQMRVTPLSEGGVEFSTRVEATGPHSRVSRAAVQDAQGFVRVCGWCHKVHDGRAWTDLEASAGRVSSLASSPAPLLTYGTCDSCMRTMRAALAERTGGVTS